MQKETFDDIKYIKDKVNILFDIVQDNRVMIRRLERQIGAKKFWDRTFNLAGGMVGGCITILSTKLLGK